MSSIVLDERKWAEEAIACSGFLGGKMETLIRLAKYYRALGQGKAEIKRSLISFMDSHGEDASRVDARSMIESAVKVGWKYPLFVSDGVDITDAEIRAIEAVKGVQPRRLAFTLLCLSKYLDQKRSENNGWVSTPDNEIMKMANMKPPIRKQSELFAKLAEAGLIRFSRKVSDCSVQVLFRHPGNTVLHVSDFRNLGFQYMRLYHDDYFNCQNCGITMKIERGKRGPKFKYCPDCAKKISVRQRVNYVMRQRGTVQP